jgi:hypothetical protein
MKFMAEATQRSPRIEAFRVVCANVDGTASSTAAELPEGFTRASIAVSSDVYTMVFTQPFARAPVVSITPLESGTGVSIIANISSITASTLVFRCESDASAADSPTGFHVLVVGYDSEDVI